MDKLRNLKSSNPRIYWNLLSSKKPNEVKANINDLLKHFKLLASNEQECSNGVDTDKYGGDTDLEADDSMLNCEITEEEILKAIATLKNGKAGGTDCIINEYIKSSKD